MSAMLFCEGDRVHARLHKRSTGTVVEDSHGSAWVLVQWDDPQAGTMFMRHSDIRLVRPPSTPVSPRRDERWGCAR